MGDEISIKVKTLDGQSRDVKVSKNATVMDLKARIEQLTKMPKNRQRIIYQGIFRTRFRMVFYSRTLGRVLQDSMKLDSDNGKMDGSAVHVVESAPPGTGSSGSSSSRPSTSSASRTQERLINGETIQVLENLKKLFSKIIIRVETFNEDTVMSEHRIIAKIKFDVKSIEWKNF